MVVLFLVLKIWNAWWICISSLCRGHANLLCIIPILEYVLPKRAREQALSWIFCLKVKAFSQSFRSPSNHNCHCTHTALGKAGIQENKTKQRDFTKAHRHVTAPSSDQRKHVFWRFMSTLAAQFQDLGCHWSRLGNCCSGCSLSFGCPFQCACSYLFSKSTDSCFFCILLQGFYL